MSEDVQRPGRDARRLPQPLELGGELLRMEVTPELVAEDEVAVLVRGAWRSAQAIQTTRATRARAEGQECQWVRATRTRLVMRSSSAWRGCAMRRLAYAVAVGLLVLTAFVAGADLGAEQARQEVGALVEAPEIVMVANASSCRRVRQAVRVRVSRRRWPHVAAHVVAIRDRFPRVWHLDRRHADEHRAESLRGIPTKPGYDRDEQPPAFSREGGEGADVRLVPSGENRSQGSVMRHRLRAGCNGQRFRLVVRR
jgi:hypothetical protein